MSYSDQFFDNTVITAPPSACHLRRSMIRIGRLSPPRSGIGVLAPTAVSGHLSVTYNMALFLHRPPSSGYRSVQHFPGHHAFNELHWGPGLAPLRYTGYRLSMSLYPHHH